MDEMLIASKPWDEVKDTFAQAFPDLDQSFMRDQYEHVRRMQDARANYNGLQRNPDLAHFLQTPNPMPFTGPLATHVENVQYGRARQRVLQGTPEEGDYDRVARREETQRAAEGASFGARAGSAVLGVIPIAAESMMTGGVSGLVRRTAAMPSMWLPQWSERNIAAGRDPTDLRGAGTAFATGVIQNAIFGRLASRVRSDGLRGLATGVLAGMGEQQAADVATRAIGLQEHAGLMETAITRGFGPAAEDAAIQALTFTILGAIHHRPAERDRTQGESRPPVSETFEDAFGHLRRQGLSDIAAGRTLQEVSGRLSEALQANPDLGSSEAVRLFDDIRLAPLREYGRALAETLPEHLPPAGPEPGIDRGPEPSQAPRIDPNGEQASTPGNEAPNAVALQPEPLAGQLSRQTGTLLERMRAQRAKLGEIGVPGSYSAKEFASGVHTGEKPPYDPLSKVERFVYDSIENGLGRGDIGKHPEFIRRNGVSVGVKQVGNILAKAREKLVETAKAFPDNIPRGELTGGMHNVGSGTSETPVKKLHEHLREEFSRQDQLDKIGKQIAKDLAKGPIDPQKEADYVATLNRVIGESAAAELTNFKKHPQPPGSAGTAPVRRKLEPASQAGPAREGAVGPAQGNAPSAPAAAGSGAAGGDVVKETKKQAEWSAIAREAEASIDPAELHARVMARLEEDAAIRTSEDSMEKVRKEVYRAFNRLGHSNIEIRNAIQRHDITALAGYDLVYTHIDESLRPLVDSVAERYGNTSDAIFQILQEKPHERLKVDDAYQQVLDKMVAEKLTAREDVADVIAETKKAGGTQSDAEAILGQAQKELAAQAAAEADRIAQDEAEAFRRGIDLPEPGSGDSAVPTGTRNVEQEVAPGVSFAFGPGGRRPSQPGASVAAAANNAAAIAVRTVQPRPTGGLAGVVETIKKWFAPASRGTEAAEAAGTLRENLAIMARQTGIAQEALKRGADYLDTHVVQAPDEPTRKSRFLEFTDAIELDRIHTLPTELRDVATAIRDLIDQRTQTLKAKDILKSFIENYFGHLWKQGQTDQGAQEIGRMMMGRRPLAGAETFRKQRYIPTYREGIDVHGLEPVSWNPAELALINLRQMDKSIMGRSTVAELKENGLLRFFSLGEKKPEGWKTWKDKLTTVFAPPEFKTREWFDQKQVDALEKVAANLGVTHTRTTTGPPGMHEPGAPGQPGKITTRFATPEEVLAHEIGHEIDVRWKLGQALNADTVIAPELRNLADYRFEGQTPTDAYQKYVRKGTEKIANLVAAYIHAPELLQQVAPNAKRFFEDFISQNPELRGLKDVKPSLVMGSREATHRLAGPQLVGEWASPEGVADIMDNYLAPGWRGNPVYDAVAGVGGTLNMFQLGFSFFHGGFVVGESMISGTALGLRQISRGDFGRGVGTILSAPLAPIKNYLEGTKMQREYYAPGSQGHETSLLLRAFEQAGGRAAMDAFYGSGHLAEMRKALKDLRHGNLKVGGSIILRAAPAAAEAFAYPVMQDIVPKMKMGAWANAARYEMEKLGPGVTPEKAREVFGRVWDSIDNRLGQMTYDNLFWKRALKDGLMAGVRSVGWNLGTWRELGGGVKDVNKSLAGIVSGEGITQRTAYAVALPMVAAVFGSIYHYLMNGKGPDELKDAFFPRTGRMRPDGSADRVSLPSYMRDVAALTNRYDEGPYRWFRNVGTMAVHKAHPLVATFAEMVSGNDYYGRAIVDPNDPAMRQTLDAVRHLLLSPQPFAIRGYQQQRETGGTVPQAAQSFIGITPAPSYVVHSAEQQRQMESGRRIQMTPLERRRRAP